MCEIKGKSYKLGDIAGSKENFAVAGALLALATGGEGDYGYIVPEGRRVLEEALISGNGEKVAQRAMADLVVKVNKGSDFMKALGALANSFVA